MAEHDWLAELKARDEVVVCHRGYGADRYVVEKVTRITRTQVVVGAWRFRKTNASEVGGSVWHSKTIHPPAPPMLERAGRTAALERLGRQSWKALSTDLLTRIVAILDEQEDRNG
jgi:hypothetical protein